MKRGLISLAHMKHLASSNPRPSQNTPSTPNHSIPPNQEQANQQLHSTFANAPYTMPDLGISPIRPSSKAKCTKKQYRNVNEAFKQDGLNRSIFMHTHNHSIPNPI